MSKSGHLSAARAFFAFSISFGVGLSIGTERLRASPAQTNLQLEVFINEIPTNQIGSFVRLDDGRIGATMAELADLGLRTGGTRAADDLVYLDEVPTATYKYDEQTQRISITIDTSQRIAREYNASNSQLGSTRAQTGYGSVLNYNLLLSTNNFLDPRPSLFNGASLTLDGRAFSPLGTVSQSAYVRSDQHWRTDAFRLDSTYRYSDQEHLITYSAGDAITGGLPWTRPIRFGGVQAQRNFSLRPDLITVPLPTVSGTAAVPSTVDVYVDNIKTFSQDVGAGPFSLANIPVVSGAGNARIVVRDATGHETTTTVPLYSSPDLLAPGLTSFSVEAGFPRLAYGTPADTYANSPVGAATVRRGVYDWLTLEGHAEGGSGLINGGVGAVARVGPFGTLSGAISASKLGESRGVRANLAFEGRLFGISVNGSTMRTFGDYDDLASAGAPPANAMDPNSALFGTSARPARALYRITIGAPLPFEANASVSASFLHILDGGGNRSDIVTASWSRALAHDASIFATAFADFGDTKNNGIFVGFSTRLFDSASTSTSVSRGTAGMTVNVDAVKPLGAGAGSFGWRVLDSEGAAAYREASLAYRSRYARMQATAGQHQGDIRGSLEVEGSMAAMGGGVFFANRIDDAFAVVRAGAPNVPVLLDNRQIGVTDAKGLILVPSLRSYDSNKIAIDPSNLPVDANIAMTRTIVAPADRSGVLIDFGVHTDTSSALVVFRRADGSFVPVGSSGKSETGEEFVVGYDGQAFLQNLAAQNAVMIATPQGQCQAQFDYVPRANEQVVISPVMCGRLSTDDGQPDLRASLR